MGAGNSCSGADSVLGRGRSTLQDASLQIDLQINDLERRIAKAEKDAKSWAAKADSEPSAKVRAVQILKQKKMFEQQRDRLLGTHFNVENVQFQQEQAELTYLAAQAMQKGADRLRMQQELMPVDLLEQLADEMHDLTVEFRDAQDVLAREGACGDGLEDVEGEFLKLQAEAAAADRGFEAELRALQVEAAAPSGGEPQRHRLMAWA